MMPKYKRIFSRINFNNLPVVVRYWCELFLGVLILDRLFYFAVPLIETAKTVWIGLKLYQCIKGLVSLLVWELIEIENEEDEE